MLFECLLCLVHPLPWVESITGNTDAFLFLFTGSCFRLYLPLRSLFFRSMLNANAARFITSLSGVNFTPAFVVRAYLHLYPVLFITSVTAAMYCVSSYLLRMFEDVGCGNSSTPGCTPITFADSLWMVAQTVLHIGYGAPVATPSSFTWPIRMRPRVLCVFAGTVVRLCPGAHLAES